MGSEVSLEGGCPVFLNLTTAGSDFEPSHPNGPAYALFPLVTSRKTHTIYESISARNSENLGTSPG